MEHDVWKAIYEQFYRPLYLCALSLCRNRDDAEDLVQSTFLKAFLSYEEGGSIRYWLTKVLQNAATLETIKTKEICLSGKKADVIALIEEMNVRGVHVEDVWMSQWTK